MRLEADIMAIFFFFFFPWKIQSLDPAMALFSNKNINPWQTEQTLPHYILEESNFNFRYARQGDLHIPREKQLIYLQTVETLIRRRVLRRLSSGSALFANYPFTGLPTTMG